MVQRSEPAHKKHRHIRERLKEKDHLALVGATAAMTIHEIAQPLNGLFTTVQLIERKLRKGQGNEDLLSLTGHVISELSRLRSLISDLRCLSKPRTLHHEATTLPDLIRQIAAGVVPIDLERPIQFDMDFPEGFPPVMLDSQRMTEVFFNLITNAVEALPDGGNITVTGRYSEKDVAVEISDTGAGIPADLKLFEPFSTTKAEGTGLGLVIVKQIVQAHCGSVSWTSEQGKGTTFCVVLPLRGTNRAA